jgi:hypothetical protein
MRTEQTYIARNPCRQLARSRTMKMRCALCPVHRILCDERAWDGAGSPVTGGWRTFVFFFPNDKSGCPILRAFCEGWVTTKASPHLSF